MQKTLECLAATAELMGQDISPVALKMMAKDLHEYPQGILIEAFARLRREAKARFSLAAIIEQIDRLQPDGRPGVDEAWAMIPRDEYASCVMTEEMGEALHVAQPLLNEGDQVAARMAFKEAYVRLVDANKRAGVKPKWFPSLGMDKTARDACLEEAVRLGRLGAEHAAGLLAPQQAAALLENHAPKLAIENKSAMSKEQAMQNIARMKEMIATSKIGSAA